MTEIIDKNEILDSDLPEDVKEHWRLGYAEGYEHGFREGQKEVIEKSNPWLNSDLREDECVSNLDPKTIAIAALNEHPHSAAIILAFIDPMIAAKVLLELPWETRPNLVARLAKLEDMTTIAIQKLNEYLPFNLPNPNEQKIDIDGIAIASSILACLPRNDENEIMEKIASWDSVMAKQIDDLRFYFSKIEFLRDEDLQTLLREIDQEDLLISLKNASDTLKEKIFNNMSDRASAMLKEDLGNLSPLTIGEIEEAQARIVGVVAKLDEEGKIIVDIDGEDYV